MKPRFRDIVIVLATVLPLVGAVSWLVTRRPQAVDRAVDLGEIRELARGRQFDLAQSQLDIFLREHPTDYHANLLMAEVATDRPDPQPGLALDRLRNLRPATPEKAALVQFFMGKARYQQGRYDLSEVCWREAIRLHPTVPEAGWALLDLMALEGRMDEAHRLGLELHEIEPDPRDRVRLLLELGLLDINKSAPGSVVIVFEPLVKVIPHDLTVARIFGLALIHDSRIERGLEVLLAALRSHPDSPEAWDAWLTGLDDAGRAQELAAEYARLPKSFVPDIRFARHAGLVAQGVQDWQTSAQAYERASVAAPYDGVILYRLSRAARLAGDAAKSDRIEKRLKAHQTAYVAIRTVIEDTLGLARLGYEPRPDLYHHLADLREQMGRSDDALAWHRLVLRDRPNDPASLAAIARLSSRPEVSQARTRSIND